MTKRLLSLALLIACLVAPPPPLVAPVFAYDSITFKNNARGQGSSFSMDVGTSANTIVLVQTCNDSAGSPITNVTVGGSAATKLDNSTFDSGNGESQMWARLVGTGGGSTNISVTGGGALNVQAAAYGNVAAIEAHKVTDTGSGVNSASASITTLTDTAVSWALICGRINTAANVSYPTNVANNRNPVSGDIGSVASVAFADSGSITTAGATTQTISWTGGSSSGVINIYQVVLKPTGAPVGAAFKLWQFFTF